jgi:hypothetical protein
MPHKLYKIKNNIYVIKYLFYYKILKLSFDNYYIDKYKKEFENYNRLLPHSKNICNVENFNKIIYLENISIDDYFEILILDNKIKISFSSFYTNLPKKTNFVCLVSDYNDKNLTFDKVILRCGLNNIDAYMYNILFNRYKASSSFNFKHCDFKVNNILILENGDASIFDLDFSIFIKNNHYIDIYNYDVNLYLDMPDGARISGDFLDIFDNYLLSISIIYTQHITRSKIILSKMKKFVSENENIAEFYKIFIIIFANLLEYCQIKISVEEYNKLLRYSYIIKVLNDLKKINVDVDDTNTNTYTNAFIFIEKILLQMSLMNMIFNKYIMNNI